MGGSFNCYPRRGSPFSSSPIVVEATSAFYEEFNNLNSLPSALETSFESRDVAFRKCQHGFASSFRRLHPSCYEGNNGVNPYASDPDASDSDDSEYQPY